VRYLPGFNSVPDADEIQQYLLVPYVSWTVLSIVCAVLFTTGGQLRFAGNWYAANAHLPYCPPKDGFM
jgi:hypothetical protein